MIKVFAVVLLCVIVSLQLRLWQGDGSIGEVKRLQQAIEVQKVELAKLQERNQLLMEDIEDLKTESNTIEEMARLELGMIKPDEMFCQIVEPVR